MGFGQYFWLAVGVVIVLIVEGLVWIIWRFWGSGPAQTYVSKEEQPHGDFRIVRKMKTPVQRVALVEHQGDWLIYGNGDVMFGTTEDENIYAESLVHLPMAVAGKRERILIIGGGGGITTREALRYPEVKAITVVDVDPVMFDFGKHLEALVRFNEGALNHPNVRTVVEDGRKFIEKTEETWDVILLDLPEPSYKNPSLSHLFSWEFYRLLHKRLNPNGVINVACPAMAWLPDYLWSVQATLVAAGFYVLPYHFDVIFEHEDDYGFCMASRRPIDIDRISISIPTRYLSPERLKDMFYFPYNNSKRWSNYKIQTDLLNSCLYNWCNVSRVIVLI
jgi:spermidine synthase